MDANGVETCSKEDIDTNFIVEAEKLLQRWLGRSENMGLEVGEPTWGKGWHYNNRRGHSTWNVMTIPYTGINEDGYSFMAQLTIEDWSGEVTADEDC